MGRGRIRGPFPEHVAGNAREHGAGPFRALRAILRHLRELLFTTASLVVTGAAGAFFLGVSRICVLPALIIREGLGARLVSVSAINAAVAAFVVIGYVLILWNGLRGGRRSCW